VCINYNYYRLIRFEDKHKAEALKAAINVAAVNYTLSAKIIYHPVTCRHFIVINDNIVYDCTTSQIAEKVSNTINNCYSNFLKGNIHV